MAGKSFCEGLSRLKFACSPSTRTTIGLIFIAYTFIQCQKANENVLPFLKDDKYSVVDINGKKILPFEFQKVAIYQDLKVIAGLKEDLWGLYTLDGKVILVLKTAKKQRYGEMLEVLHEKSQRWRYLSKDISIPLLISINDYSSNVSYIVNPQYPQGQYPKLKRSFDNTDDIVRNSDFTFSKLFRVVESDDKINYINEKGAKLYENGSDDGFVISDDLIAASEGEKYALHKPDKKQSDHLYSKVYLHLHLWNFTYLSM